MTLHVEKKMNADSLKTEMTSLPQHSPPFMRYAKRNLQEFSNRASLYIVGDGSYRGLLSVFPSF